MTLDNRTNVPRPPPFYSGGRVTKIKLLSTLLTISLTLSACSALSPLSVIDAVKPQPTFDINTQLGKENTQNRSLVDARKVEEVNLSGAQRTNLSKSGGVQSAEWTAQTITVHQNTQQPIGYFYLLLLIAGWILPDPVSCWHWLKGKWPKFSKSKKKEVKV